MVLGREAHHVGDLAPDDLIEPQPPARLHLERDALPRVENAVQLLHDRPSASCNGHSSSLYAMSQNMYS